MNKFWNGFCRSESAIRRVALYSLILNISLVFAKLALSVVTGSLALRADAIHSLVDVFGSLALIMGLIISNWKSSSFPYGFYKVENLVSILISLLLFLTAYEIVREALTTESLINPYGGWVLLAVGLMIPAPLLFGRFEARVGKIANSPSLIADGSQFKVDALTASIVLFALLGQRYGVPLDRIAALVIAIFVIKAGWNILVDGMRVLLDASVDAQTLMKIRAIVEAEPTVSAVKAVTARNSGRYLFVEVDVTLRITDLKRAHQASELMEKKIREAVPHVDRVLIHYEPQIRTKIRYVLPLANAKGEISIHFGEAPFFSLVEIDLQRKAVSRRDVLANPYRDLTKGRGLRVAEFLLGHKPDVVLTRENLSGKGPGYAFADAGVETVQIEAESLDKIVKDLLTEIKKDSANQSSVRFI
jgi:cation diffusion facilitator family transporter